MVGVRLNLSEALTKSLHHAYHRFEPILQAVSHAVGPQNK